MSQSHGRGHPVRRRQGCRTWRADPPQGASAVRPPTCDGRDDVCARARCVVFKNKNYNSILKLFNSINILVSYNDFINNEIMFNDKFVVSYYLITLYWKQ